MKEKSGKSLWITPPSPEMTSSFKAFLTLGWKLRGELNTVTSLVEDESELEEALARLRRKSPKEEDRRAHDKASRGEKPSLKQELLNLLKLSGTFPFLEKHFIPLSARVAIAILASIYVERAEQATLENLQKIFRLIRLPIESYKDEGDRLVNYALKGDSYLDIAENRDATGYVLALSRSGFKDLFGVELEETFTEKMAYPQGMFRCSKGNEESTKEDVGTDYSNDVIVPKVTLKDVVLDNDSKFRLEYLIKHSLRDKKSFFKLLFWGPPGTGKTHTAMSISGELKKKVIMLDLSKVYGKYTGETERNISSYFEHAEKEKAILLMDEADSFFKQRTAENPSWENRYVNQAIMLIERKPVNVILCTNLFNALDEALLRRIDEVLEFKIPNTEERTEIWKKELLKNKISEMIDIEHLVGTELSGGLIANAAKKAQKIKVVLGENMTINTEFLKTLAVEEKQKMGGSAQEKRIYGFGG